jgi:hypothetical protein
MLMGMSLGFRVGGHSILAPIVSETNRLRNRACEKESGFCENIFMAWAKGRLSDDRPLTFQSLEAHIMLPVN